MHQSVITLTYATLVHNFDHSTLIKAQTYIDQKRIIEYKSSNDNKMLKITGKVRGSGNNKYLVVMHCMMGRSGVAVTSECSCPVVYQCKHAAALALDYLHDKQRLTSPSSPVAAPPFTMTTFPTKLAAKNLSYAVNEWLDGFGEFDPNKKELKNLRELLYVITVSSDPRVYEIQCSTSQRLKIGGWGALTAIKYSAFETNVKYITRLDREIHDLILMERSRSRSHHRFNAYKFALTDKYSQEAMRKIIETNRFFWRTITDSPIISGIEIQGELAWKHDQLGKQYLSVQVDDPNLIVFTIQLPWYYNPSTQEMGKINTGIQPLLLEKLLHSPTIEPHEMTTVFEKLLPLIQQKIPAPTQFKKEIITTPPIPHLYLYPNDDVNYKDDYNNDYDDDVEYQAYAELTFQYLDNIIPQKSTIQIVHCVKDNVIQEMPRNALFEKKAVQLLNQAGMALLYNAVPYGYYNVMESGNEFGFEDETIWPNFMATTVPQLREKGWVIEIDPDFPFNYVAIDDDAQWYTEIDETSGIDWFTVEVGILLDGKRVNIIPAILRAINKMGIHARRNEINETPDNTKIEVITDEGQKLLIPFAQIKSILQTLTELYDADFKLDNGKLRLPSLRATQLLELEKAAKSAAQFRWFGGEKVRSLAQKIKEFDGIKTVAVPEAFQAQLRAYQQEGVNWLQFLREYQLGGILADDMGLGKTVQTLAHLTIEKKENRINKPVLIIAPTSLMFNWRMEAERFAPDLSILTLHGKERKTTFSDINNYDLVLTTYPLLVRDEDFLKEQQFYYLILDEAQIVKNPSAKATQIVQLLKADHRLCLTGTPMENHLGELWSLFNFILPGLLGEQKQFNRLFRFPIEKQQSSERREVLGQRIAPFMLRRSKKEVVKELPEKIEMTRSVEMEADQRKLYETVRIAMHKKVADAISKKGLARSQIVILDALLKLRQVCCDPRLLKIESAKKSKAKSAKLELLIELVTTLLAEGRKILLFSQFTEMLALIEIELIANSMSYVKLTGSIIDRATPINQFQNGDANLFLISLKAGGVGLNLTSADVVIHYDPWWNPAVEQQATDRAHRIGQKKTVFVYKLITHETVEEKIITLQDKKRALLEGLFDENVASKSNLKSEDIAALFNASHLDL